MIYLLSSALATSIILVVLWDAFATMVLPRTLSLFRPSIAYYRMSWALWRKGAVMIPDSQRRQTFLAVFGPLSVILLLAFWAVTLIVCFAVLHWGLKTRLHPLTEPPTLWNLLYMSGSTFFTLGMGDLAPVNGLGRFLVILEAATGFTLLAIIIGYMPLLDQAYSSREVNIVLLHARGESYRSALHFLKRVQGKDPAHLEISLRGVEQWIAELLQSHLSHPVLAYYRSQHLGQSWVISLTVLMDTSTLLMVGENKENAERAEELFRLGREALVELSRALQAIPREGAKSRLRPEDFSQLREAVERDRFPLLTGAETEEKFNQLRSQYEPYAVAIAEKLVVPLPPWMA